MIIRGIAEYLHVMTWKRRWERYHRPLAEVSDLLSCWYLVCSTGSDYYCGLSVNCYMITKDNNFQIRRICFGMPRHLKGGLVWIMFNPLKSEDPTNECVYKSGVWANKYVFILCLIFRYLGSAWPRKIKHCQGALLGLEADHLYCWGSSEWFQNSFHLGQETFSTNNSHLDSMDHSLQTNWAQPHCFTWQKGFMYMHQGSSASAGQLQAPSVGQTLPQVTNSHHHFALFCIFSKHASFAHLWCM